MIVVHHLNNSRSQRVLWLLEELGADYEVKRYERDPTTMLAPPGVPTRARAWRRLPASALNASAATPVATVDRAGGTVSSRGEFAPGPDGP
jgi:hypothetical protein